MYRSATVSRRVLNGDGIPLSTIQRRLELLKQSRRRNTTASSSIPPSATASLPPPPPPPPKRHPFRVAFLYTAVFLATFYGVSTGIATRSEGYRDFFIERVPLGERIVDWTDSKGWDRAGVKAKGVNEEAGGALSKAERKVEQKVESVAKSLKEGSGRSQSGSTSGSDATQKTPGVLDRVKNVTDAVLTSVERNVVEIKEGRSSAKVRHQASQLSEGIEDLVREAEEAIKTTVANVVPVASVPPLAESNAAEPGPPPEVTAPDLEQVPANVYTLPLPLEHYPPPGYVLPPKPKSNAPEQPAVEAEPAPPPLPWIAEALAEISRTEPLIGQVAEAIDKLSGLLQSHPSSATEAKNALAILELDLNHLVKRMDQIKVDELARGQEKLDAQARENSAKFLSAEIAAQELADKQEDRWRTAFEQERDALLTNYREKLENELKSQSQIIDERLRSEVISQGVKYQEHLITEIATRVEQERDGRLSKLRELATALTRLQKLTIDNSSYLDESVRLHALWSSLRALESAISSAERTPFREELQILRKVASERKDAIISATLDSIEGSAVADAGVLPFQTLASWFTTSVAPSVVSVALVPEQDAGVLSHVISALLAVFRPQPRGFVEGGDVASVVARAESFMSEGDLDSAARELNQLRGTPKLLLADWLAAARQRLEVQQALLVVRTRASEASLQLS
ncbi:hypothetical protein SISNIDRAFT_113757 [Sistotremastrum niveocremeum HHB9708]|uniref:MICOS complex subunit MIC60 n=1 Tax=Sistotremastrum niveocremeum HHB9708 TaxID=1314777 RepID=A0A164TKK9_9AGAM|nr:hypothetical protein SISNIDRAFT_113757 [Sistotremastrum niveocremeum HHB9708]